MSSDPKKIVVIGGGTGTYTVLSCLKNKEFDLAAVVSMCDDGGSTGRLRDSYGVLPAGDIRRSLIALAADENKARDLFDYRFEEGELAGHNFGNIFLAAVEKVSGNFYDAVKTAGIILNIDGRVHPVTLKNIRLYAELEDGSTVSGETNIDIPKHNPRLAIKRVFIKPEKSKANPDAISAICNAHTIIIGPGDLYTSILPNFLVRGVANAVKKSKAKKIYICNLMTKYGETNDFSVQNFVDEIEKYIGRDTINYILVNNKKPNADILSRYKKYNTQLVSLKDFKHSGLYTADIICDGELVRHDKNKLSKILVKLINA